MATTRGIPSLLAVAVVLVAAIGIATPAQAAAPDWVVEAAHFPAGGGSVQIGGTAVPNGKGPVVVGSGFGDGRGGLLFVDDLGNGGISLRTTDDVGGLSVQVTSPAPGTFHFIVDQGVFGKNPIDLDMIFFVANASFTSLDAHVHGGTIDSTSGSGTQAIYVAGPGTSGVAVDASAVAAGTSTTSRQLATGIVGGATFECTECTIGWTSPDGASGSVSETNTPFPPVPVPVPIPGGGFGSGDPVFAGPAGSWQWSWTGATVNFNPSTAVVGAYAPIGNAWRMFRGGGGSLGGGSGGGSFGGSGGAVGGGPNSSKPSTKVAGKREARTLANTGVASDALGWMLLVAACLAARRLRAITS